MTKKQKSNLAKTAIWLLDHTDGRKIHNGIDRKFDMEYYARDNNRILPPPKRVIECGMSCCFAGCGPLALGGTKETNWNNYLKKTFGVTVFIEGVFFFLFYSAWPNSPKQAASRALVFLEKGDVPKYGKFNKKYLTHLSKKALKDRLFKFVKN